MKNITEVEIFGSKYTIKSDTAPSYTIELANFVDKKIREIAKNSSAVSSHKIIVLASMNIANELFQLKGEFGDKDIQFDEKIEELIQIIKGSQK